MISLYGIVFQILRTLKIYIRPFETSWPSFCSMCAHFWTCPSYWWNRTIYGINFGAIHIYNCWVNRVKALSHYNFLVQRPNCVREKLYSEQNVGKRLKKLRKSSHPQTWFRPCTVFPPFTAFFYRSCTAQSTFLPRPTTFCCQSATVLDDLQPPVLRPCESSAFLYRPSSVRLMATSQFI